MLGLRKRGAKRGEGMQLEQEFAAGGWMDGGMERQKRDAILRRAGMPPICEGMTMHIGNDQLQYRFF